MTALPKQSLSSPHTKFDAPLDWELPHMLKMRGYDVNNLAVQEDDIKVGMDAYSHYVYGDSALDAILDGPKAQEYCAYLQDLPIETLSGETALEKGLSFAAIVEAIRQQEDAQRGAQIVKAALDQLKSDEEQDGETPGSGQGGPQPEDKLIQELDRDSVMFLAALAKIKSIKTANIGKAVERVIDPDSLSHVEEEYMTDLSSQISRVNPNDFADPLLVQKLAEMDFQIDQHYKLVEKKKVFFLLIDRSSSMFSPPMKQAYVKGMIKHLCDGVKQGNCILLAATFERDIDEPITLVDDAASADAYFANYSCPGGSTTEVNDCIHKAQAMLASGKVKHRNGVYQVPADAVPQVVVINDGQDYVDESNVPKYEVHAIMLDALNESFKKLCLKTRGTFHFIP